MSALTPAQFANAVLRPDTERNVELRGVVEHARLGHRQTWHDTRDVGLSEDRGSYLIVVKCSCSGEFYVAKVSDRVPDEDDYPDVLDWKKILSTIDELRNVVHEAFVAANGVSSDELREF